MGIGIEITIEMNFPDTRPVYQAGETDQQWCDRCIAWYEQDTYVCRICGKRPKDFFANSEICPSYVREKPDSPQCVDCANKNMYKEFIDLLHDHAEFGFETESDNIVFCRRVSLWTIRHLSDDDRLRLVKEYREGASSPEGDTMDLSVLESRLQRILHPLPGVVYNVKARKVVRIASVWLSTLSEDELLELSREQ